MKLVGRSEIGPALGLCDASGEPVHRGVADALRQAVHRWQVADRSAVLRHVRGQLSAVQASDTTVAKAVLDQLVSLGDLSAVHVDGTQYIVPSEPRWMQTAPDAAVALGLSQLPSGLRAPTDQDPLDILHRVALTPDLPAEFEASQVRKITLDEWLEPLAYQRTAESRGFDSSWRLELQDYWALTIAKAHAEALPASEDADLRVLTGPPGGFFGRYSSPEPEGRWSTDATSGDWLGYRHGYGEAHWHPVILSITDGRRRVWDLFDADEFRWLLLARSIAQSEQEVVHRSERQVRFTFPLPDQLTTAMDLLGRRSGAWTWDIASTVELPLEALFLRARSAPPSAQENG